MLLADNLFRRGEYEAGLIVLLSFDCYLRESDWQALAPPDIVDDGSLVALVLGVSERGERTKTGANQGMVIDMGVRGGPHGGHEEAPGALGGAGVPPGSPTLPLRVAPRVGRPRSPGEARAARPSPLCAVARRGRR